MSYLNHPILFFSGKFHADPSTINNTPDNYNPNANFPPANGDEVGNNIQLYWNPNGTGKFALDCTVTKVCDKDGNVIEDSELLGQRLVSKGGDKLSGAKLVDLDPMQQNVTELWGLGLEIPDCNSISLGDVTPSAYSNAWVQVVDGQGDYAGSVLYQSVIKLDGDGLKNSTHWQKLIGDCSANQLSVSFVVRAYNSSSFNYLINDTTLFAMNKAGVPELVTDKLKPIELYNQRPEGSGTPGQIPTTSYFEKLVNALITADESTQYLAAIKESAVLEYTPRTEFDFTYGQVFGVIGPKMPDEPPFLTPARMLTPPSVTTDTASYSAYFAPFTVSCEWDAVNVNLGNALPSSIPASAQDSHVAKEALGKLQLCYFDGGVRVANAVILGDISYQDNDFYFKDAGISKVMIDPQHASAIETCPLGIISSTSESTNILIQENSEGYYLRANQFVFRMNPGVKTSAEDPRGETQAVEIYVRKFGKPVVDTDIAIALMPSVESSVYTDNTLGTGGSSGLVNMGVPTTALSFPEQVKTDADGIARFTITATNPGAPRGYVDGQIYFLQYGFSDPALKANYVQSPDNLISIQVYTQQPNIEEVTWANFVQPTLGLYNKLYPTMGFLDLDNEQSVIQNAEKIYQAMNRHFGEGSLMPVTRDLSDSRLCLLNRWLRQHFSSKKGAFAKYTNKRE